VENPIMVSTIQDTVDVSRRVILGARCGQSSMLLPVDHLRIEQPCTLIIHSSPSSSPSIAHRISSLRIELIRNLPFDSGKTDNALSVPSLRGRVGLSTAHSGIRSIPYCYSGYACS